MNCLLLSMPGTPVIYYGDEIGMGDNIHLGDRDGVRTPMQWSPDRNGGFSRADPARLVLPPIMDPLYGYRGGQCRGADRRPAFAAELDAAHARGAPQPYQAFGRGDFRLLYPKNRKVLAYLREYEDDTILCVANLARTPQAVELDLSRIRRPDADRTRWRLGISADRPAELSADAAALWLLLVPSQLMKERGLADNPYARARTHARISDHRCARQPARASWRTPLRAFERDILPAYLAKRRRWFATKDQVTQACASPTQRRSRQPRALLTEIEAVRDSGERYGWCPPASLGRSGRAGPLPSSSPSHEYGVGRASAC